MLEQITPHLLLGVLSGVSSWGITEGARRLVHRQFPDAAWHTLVLRAAAMVSGAAAGVFGGEPLGVPSWRVAFLVGACAGALCTFIVRLVKGRASTLAGTGVEP